MEGGSSTGDPQAQATHDLIARIFACSADVAAQVMRRGRIRAYAGHATILRQGDWLSTAFLLLLGRAQALLYSADGQMVLLHEYHPGDLFGALGELEPVRQEADVRALEDARALVLEAAEFAMLAQQHGCISLALSRMLLKRLRKATERMYERAAVSAMGRVYAELLRQAREAPDLAIRPSPVIAELALRVSTTRETASRAINGLQRRGIIRRDADALIVSAPGRLEEMIF
ncbi:Crp/Fnr family transcriptional regulator [Sphingosinicella sp. BN140058]|uniref:Crp/Fnr family transcriptional regulator n=1 Tax=Sphingosinicella sp. BN140058 TaxID=1892855 RepID=UPI00101135C1|nr:Crp/Fnr family transcriptional regulator [Sphingosinicella sp. BN140058]QAY77383.1 Crp/Fnr family transcriptional regulator [Sphingosinicella sp. BN140058]